MLKLSFLGKAVALSVLLLSANAQSALVNTDWKVLGDNKVVLDEATGMEWLSFTETLGLSTQQVMAQLGTTYNGWLLPTALDVETLINNTSLLNQGSVLNSFLGNTWGGLADSGALGIHVDANDPNNYVVSGFGGGGVFYYGGTHPTYGCGTITCSRTSGNFSYGVWLISGGGTSLTSINNPSININNPNSPYNVAAAAAAVNAPLMLGGLSLSALLFGWRKKSD